MYKTVLSNQNKETNSNKSHKYLFQNLFIGAYFVSQGLLGIRALQNSKLISMPI